MNNELVSAAVDSSSVESIEVSSEEVYASVEVSTEAPDDSVMDGVKILGKGMGALFVAMILIMLTTMIMNSFKSKKKD